MPPVSLEGKAWSLDVPLPPARPAMRRARKAPGERPASAAATHGRGMKPRMGEPEAGKSIPPPAEPGAGGEVKVETKDVQKSTASVANKENSLMAVGVVAPPGTLSPAQQYTMQDLIDSFESDPSRYPLDRTVRSDGIALTLEGVQRRGRLFVLKVAVANGGETDFFVKDFTVRAGAAALGSRSLFRVVVESQRNQEGYVVFEKPLPGAAVQIKLKEDGGKGRVLESTIPYRF